MLDAVSVVTPAKHIRQPVTHFTQVLEKPGMVCVMLCRIRVPTAPKARQSATNGFSPVWDIRLILHGLQGTPICQGRIPLIRAEHATKCIYRKSIAVARAKRANATVFTELEARIFPRLC